MHETKSTFSAAKYFDPPVSSVTTGRPHRQECRGRDRSASLFARPHRRPLIACEFCAGRCHVTLITRRRFLPRDEDRARASPLFGQPRPASGSFFEIFMASSNRAFFYTRRKLEIFFETPPFFERSGKLTVPLRPPPPQLPLADGGQF